MTTVQTPPSTRQPSVSDAWYDRLKISAQLILPAIGALYFALAQIWGLPAAEEVTGTIAALNVFAGVAVTWLKSLHDARGGAIDGTFALLPNDPEDLEAGSHLKLKSVDPIALETKDVVSFRIVK